MSVNSKMKKSTVLKLEEVESPSGAKKSKWVEMTDKINIAVYQTNQFVSKDRYRNTETTHTALTHNKQLKAGKFRLVQDNKKFEILDVDDSHRLSQLSLKEVETW